MMRIRFQHPVLPDVDQILQYWSVSREAGWYANRGPCHEELVERLEQRWYGGGVSVVPVTNATMALILALRTLGDRSLNIRKYVIVPSYTFAATATAVAWAGYSPIFVDIAQRNWHMDPSSLQSALETYAGQVAAILPCSTYGTAPNASVTRDWERLGETYDVPVLVDSAAGFGSTRGSDDELLGRQGDAEIFSFHATKPFAIGEGGLVVTRRRSVGDGVRKMTNFGFNLGRVVDEAPGVNAKLDEWHAAVALAQLDTFPEVVEHRQKLAGRMRSSLEPLGLEFQEGSETSAVQFVPMLCPDTTTRDRILRVGAESGVELRAYFDTPVHQMPAFSGAPTKDLSVTRDLAGRVICLPMYNAMSDSDCDRIIDLCMMSLTA